MRGDCINWGRQDEVGPDELGASPQDEGHRTSGTCHSGLAFNDDFIVDNAFNFIGFVITFSTRPQHGAHRRVC